MERARQHLGERVTRLEVRIDDRDTERFAHIDQRFDSLDRDLADLRGDIDARFTHLDTRFAQIDQRFSDFAQSLDAMRASIQNLGYWGLGLIVGGWLTIMVTIITLWRK